ncbi:MAG: DNA-protecting protein DprA [Bacteroidales bacterium]|nr:DNA-protecting protein DprA [Bacteroidales bacterium]
MDDGTKEISPYERACYCTLNRVFGYEPNVANRIVEHFGSAAALFGLNREGLEAVLGPGSRHIPLICGEEVEKSAAELERLAGDGMRFLTPADPGYPPLLRECPDAPVGLYYRGVSPPEEVFAESRPTVAVVGTRDVSLYGREWCGRLVSALSGAPARPTVVSGLALGVDIVAHLTALESGLPTVGVMATGVGEIYPARHYRFARQIEQSRGSALVTDYPPGTSPLALNFLRRNRIIAGMSRATVLVESRVKGGGMMTANLAFSYGRTVLAVPGRIDDPRSQGCNYLIKNNIAEPVLGLDDLPKALGLDGGTTKKKDIRAAVKEGFAGKADAALLDGLLEVAQLVRKYRGITPDELCMHTGRPYAEVAALLALLEQEDFITADLLQRCSINPKKL